jgi:hypothetical protein
MGSILGLVLIALQGLAGIETPDGPPTSLRGSPAAMEQQHRVAVEHDLTFFRTVEEIRAAVSRGDLVEMPGSEFYTVADFVDLPYLHPAARLFVTRTAAMYHEACGEQLVVTSGVRATTRQPPNAHALSVHPTGIAVDLRVSQQAACREWLEAKMLRLEDAGVVNGIREFRPPHYHIAVFPSQYMAYVGEQLARDADFTGVEEPAAAGRGPLLVLLLLGALALLAAAVAIHRRRGGEPRAAA